MLFLIWEINHSFVWSFYLQLIEDIVAGLPNSTDHWFMANIDQSGFYRVKYDMDTYFRLLNELDANYSVRFISNLSLLIHFIYGISLHHQTYYYMVYPYIIKHISLWYQWHFLQVIPPIARFSIHNDAVQIAR